MTNKDGIAICNMKRKRKVEIMTKLGFKSAVISVLVIFAVSSANAEDFRETSVVNQAIVKYKCRENVDSVRSSTPRSSSSSNNNRLSVSQIGVKLDCSKRDTFFINFTTQKFMLGLGEYHGELTTPSNRTFGQNKFCIADHTGSTLRIALCNNEEDDDDVSKHASSSRIIRMSPVRIRKCCQPNERLEAIAIYENGTAKYDCVKIPADAKQKEWKPAVFQSISDDYKSHNHLESIRNITYDIGFPICSYHSLKNSEDIWFMLLENGLVEIGLKFWFKPVWLPVEDNEFCVDEVVDHDPATNTSDVDVDSHDIYHKNQILLYCQVAYFDDYLFHRRLFGGLCVTAAAIVFMLLIIYVAIWDKQNLAGWTQFNIFVALFFVVLMEGVRTLVDENALSVKSTWSCVIIAAIAQYFFFALNTTWTVMCFDLFYMFLKLETTSKSLARYRGRLFCYLTCSWGLPLVIVSSSFYWSHHTAVEEMAQMEGIYAFAHRRCSSPIRKLGFQTQGIMFLVNLLFFLLTTGLLWKHRRGLSNAKKRSRNERHTWRSVILFLKLVIVMGVTSLTIPFDYFFGSSDPLSTVAVCFRMVHFIPFVAVLFIFGFNEKNVMLVNQKFPRIGKYFGFVACSSGANASETLNQSRSGNNRISDQPSTSTPT